MNREIKFRGKRIDNWEWVYGYYLKTYSFNTHWIIKDGLYIPDIMLGINPDKPKHLQGCYKVHPDTVGQYVTTENEQDVYEGDKVKVWACNQKSAFLSRGEGYYTGVVEFNKTYAAWVFAGFFIANTNPNKLEIIGTIHDEEKP